MSQVFVSYKAEDRPRAALIVAALEAEGLSVWWDQHIEPGSHWRESIAQSLMTAPCVIVLWTEASVGAGGRFVQDEAGRAQQRGVYLPVRLDQVDPPLGFGEQQCVSMFGWRGSRTAPEFQTLKAAAQAMLAGEPAPTPITPSPPGRVVDRRLLLGGAALGIVAAGAAGVALAPPSLLCGIGLCPADAAGSSIVVLPFRNLSGDAHQDYLGEGVSEELRNALARLGSIRVAARTSSEAFKDARGGLAAIAAKLGVAFVLDGSVRAAGNVLRVTAQLVDAKSGFERWSDSFDRTLTDVIAVQTDIAASVAEALRGRLPGAQAALVARPTTAVPAAYDALLRGSQALRAAGDEAGYRKALALFEAAAAADPVCAEAYARQATVLNVLANQFEPAARVRPTLDRAIAAARQAVKLSPESGYAQSVLGYVLLFGRLDFGGARGPYERSIQLAPNDARVVGGYGQFAAKVGKAAVSLSTLNQAVSLDPLNPLIYRVQAQAMFAARRYTEAIGAMRHALDLAPAMGGAHALIGDARFLLGEVAVATAEYRADPSAMFRLTGLSIALHRSGDAAGSVAAFRELVTRLGDSAAYQQAQVQAQWGDADATFRTLEHAFALGDGGLVALKVDPFMDPVRGDPRFAGYMRRLNLT
jgi:TolB-like protein/Flp pilus assembly protein TadD